MRRLLRWVLIGRRRGYRSKIRRRVGFCVWLDREDEAPKAPPAAPAAPVGVAAPEGFEAVIERDQLVPGEVTEAIVGGIAIAIANVDGKFHAISNVCPHAGGPLGDGTLEGSTLTCPYHGWSFDVTDGSCFVNSDVSVEVFPVEMAGDRVCVNVGAAAG